MRIRSLTEYERNRLESKHWDKSGKVDPTKVLDVKCNWIIACVVDENDNLMFSEHDVEELRRVDSAVIDAAFTAVMEHVGVASEDVQELVGN